MIQQMQHASGSNYCPGNGMEAPLICSSGSTATSTTCELSAGSIAGAVVGSIAAVGGIGAGALGIYKCAKTIKMRRLKRMS